MPFVALLYQRRSLRVTVMHVKWENKSGLFPPPFTSSVTPFRITREKSGSLSLSSHDDRYSLTMELLSEDSFLLLLHTCAREKLNNWHSSAERKYPEFSFLFSRHNQRERGTIIFFYLYVAQYKMVSDRIDVCIWHFGCCCCCFWIGKW